MDAPEGATVSQDGTRAVVEAEDWNVRVRAASEDMSESSTWYAGLDNHKVLEQSDSHVIIKQTAVGGPYIFFFANVSLGETEYSWRV